MAITRVESLVYGVNDLAAGINYYQDWGLEILEKNSKGAIFATPVGQTIYLLDKNDSSLPSAPSDNKSTVRKTVWGVDSEEELEKFPLSYQGIGKLSFLKVIPSIREMKVGFQ